MRQSTGAVSCLADEIFLAIKQFVDALDEWRDLVGKALRHTADAPALNGIQLMPHRSQRTEAEPDLDPCEKHQDRRDGNQDACDVPPERLPQFKDLLVIHRDRQIENARAGTAVNRDVMRHDIQLRPVGAFGLVGVLDVGILRR